jgi:hypothetical protein
MKFSFPSNIKHKNQRRFFFICLFISIFRDNIRGKVFHAKLRLAVCSTTESVLIFVYFFHSCNYLKLNDFHFLLMVRDFFPTLFVCFFICLWLCNEILCFVVIENIKKFISKQFIKILTLIMLKKVFSYSAHFSFKYLNFN